MKLSSKHADLILIGIDHVLTKAYIRVTRYGEEGDEAFTDRTLEEEKAELARAVDLASAALDTKAVRNAPRHSRIDCIASGIRRTLNDPLIPGFARKP